MDLITLIYTEEEKNLIEQLHCQEWTLSQSGRLKQDFSPQVNYKRRKIKFDNYKGLPAYSKALIKRMRELEILKDFIPVAQTNLEYDPLRGAGIDRHKDDDWIWGDRISVLSLRSDTVIRFYNSERSIHDSFVLLVPLPSRSLLVFSGLARYDWEHAIFYSDIIQKRISITWRELGPLFKNGGPEEHIGSILKHKVLPTLDLS
ncbi:alpha-ketoglutarate-dependent dioxygenase alkB homolog 4-like [Zophobas morio]|uniref:alpha-ketoglutarate-dependent dioxygenase alkB homolog 4-like n=1 Tax=Zophobas morio TaxID=2755281 RepID=UPI003082C779